MDDKAIRRRQGECQWAVPPVRPQPWDTVLEATTPTTTPAQEEQDVVIGPTSHTAGERDATNTKKKHTDASSSSCTGLPTVVDAIAQLHRCLSRAPGGAPALLLHRYYTAAAIHNVSPGGVSTRQLLLPRTSSRQPHSHRPSRRLLQTVDVRPPGNTASSPRSFS